MISIAWKKAALTTMRYIGQATAATEVQIAAFIVGGIAAMARKLIEAGLAAAFLAVVAATAGLIVVLTIVLAAPAFADTAQAHQEVQEARATQLAQFAGAAVACNGRSLSWQTAALEALARKAFPQDAAQAARVLSQLANTAYASYKTMPDACELVDSGLSDADRQLRAAQLTELDQLADG